MIDWVGYSGDGTTRRVFCFGALAIKVARSPLGITANRSEFGVWRRATEKRRTMLCPSYALLFGGVIVVAARAAPLSRDEFDSAWEAGRVPDWDYRPPNDEGAPFECKGPDWGWYRGNLVAIDYANTASQIGRTA
jgi:hypothetical protein